MFRRALRVFLFCLLMAALSGVSPAQSFVLDLPLQSQRAQISQRIGITDITISYHRPLVNDRKVWDALVPYGKVWRTGADEATALNTDIDLNIGGIKVPAGKYTLYTLPSEGTWKLIINKQTGQWGTKYDESQDLGRVDMKKTDLPQSVEQFTISFDKKSESTADLNMDWGNKRISVPLKID